MENQGQSSAKDNFLDICNKEQNSQHSLAYSIKISRQKQVNARSHKNLKQTNSKQNLQVILNQNQPVSQQQNGFWFHSFSQFAGKVTESKYFNYSILITLFVFFVACIFQNSKKLPQLARIMQIIQLICHIIFIFFLIFRVLKPKQQKYFWFIIDSIIILSGILGYILEDEASRYFKAIRTIKLVFFIKQIKIFNQPSSALINALAKFGNILIPALVIIYVYSVVGLHVFSDFQYNKCRSISNVQKSQNWTVYTHQVFLCGQKKCPIYQNQQLHCLNPIDYGVEPNQKQLINIIQGNNLLKYSNIFFAVLSTFKQTFVTGSSRLIILYKQVLNPIFIQIYFYSYIYLISYIYLNIFYALIITSEWNGQKDQPQIECAIQDQKKIEMENIQQVDQKMIKKSSICRQPQVLQQSNSQCVFKQVASQMTQIKAQQKQRNRSSQGQPTPKEQQTITNGDLILKKARVDNNIFQNIQLSPELISKNQLASGQIIEEPSNGTLDSQYPARYRKYQIINNIIIILCCVNLSLDYHGQSHKFKFVVDCIDFAFYCLLLIELIIRVLIERYCLRKIEFYTKLEIIIAFICTIGVIYQAAIAQSFYSFFSVNLEPVSAVIRSFKYLRIMILIFKSTIFNQARLILQSTFRSLYMIRHMAVVWLIIVMTFAIMGFHLHSYKTKVNNKTGQLDLVSGQEFQISFDSIYNSVIFTMLTFYNEQWDYIMFQQYLGGGALLVIWQLFSICVGLLLFSKYFMALLMKELDNLIDKSLSNNKDQDVEIQYQPEQKNQEIKQRNKVIPVDKSKILGKNVAFQDDIVSMRNSKRTRTAKIKSQKQLKQKQKKKDQKRDQKHQTQVIINKIMSILHLILESKIYKVIYSLFILCSCVVLMFTHPKSDQNSQQAAVYRNSDIINKSYFIIDLFLNLIVYGLFSTDKSYLRKGWLNFINVAIVIIEIVSFTTLKNSFVFAKIEKVKVLRVLNFLSLKYQHDWNMRITFHSFIQLLPKVITLLIITLIMYSYFALILVKLYKDDQYNCLNYNTDATIVTRNDCLMWGGDWVKQSVNVSNLLNSTFYLFCVATMQGWISLLYPAMNLAGSGLNPVRDANKYISLFFVLFFFFGNLVMLNVLIGLSVSNFKRLKDKNTGQSKLNQKQKQWLCIKNQIHRLHPKILPKRPQNVIRGYAYVFANHFSYKLLQGLFFCGFLISMSLVKTNMPNNQRLILHYFQYFFAFILVCEYFIELLAFGIRVQYKVSFIYKNIVVAYAIIYIIVSQTVQMEKYSSRIFGGIFIALQFIRYLALLDQIPFAKKLLNTIVSILPQTSNILLMICITLFIYAIIGMELFAFLRPNIQLDGFNQNYTNFSTALFALIKFSTLQSPMQQISDAAQSSSPNFICQEVYTYQQYLIYGQNGCGNIVKSSLFFLSFHIFYSMLLMSTVMAVIVDSYIQVKRAEQAPITKQVLDRVSTQWSKIDPQATGYIPYRQFFMFTAKLLEIYMGKSNAQDSIATIIKSKEQFLKQMQIPIYQNEDQVLCFQFNQVIDALTRIYMQVKDERVKVQKMFKQRLSITGNGFNKSCYTSSHVATLIILKSGLRWWKKIANNDGGGMHYKNAILKFNREKKGTLKKDDIEEQSV